MPEIRQNIATRDWVIISTERAQRPDQFVQQHHTHPTERPIFDPRCPFCPGNEEEELEQLRIPATGDWQLRVVRNKYPALHEGPGEAVRYSEKLNRMIPGIGYHEVLIESRLHNTSPATQAIEEVERTLMGFQRRGLVYRSDPRVEQMIFFKNHGSTAGTSLMHPHSQMVALPVVPSTIRMRSTEARRFFEDNGHCVYCQMLNDEELDQHRLITTSKHFVAFIPFAALSPFHTWICPRRHAASFLSATADEIADLAVVMRDVLRRIYIGLNDPDYNYVIRSSPEYEFGARYLHWYMVIIPRVSQSAGFEMGSGMFINTALPEQSAQFLRDIRPDQDSDLPLL